MTLNLYSKLKKAPDLHPGLFADTMNYTEVKITVAGQDQKERLIAALTEAGFEGFEESGDLLMAFMPEGKIGPEQLHTLLTPFEAPYLVSTVAQQNWNEIWESSFEPVHVGNFCVIRAGFHAPEPGFRHEIVITPKMSFGTGHHATTFLMIESMQEIDFREKTVLDFGTGTGVLAILAEKLGAAGVHAIDLDEWSIANARENLETNGAQHVTLEQNDAVRVSARFDVILANINKNILLQHMASLKAHLRAGGVLLLSGLLLADRNEITRAAGANGLHFCKMREKENWISIQFIGQED